MWLLGVVWRYHVEWTAPAFCGWIALGGHVSPCVKESHSGGAGGAAGTMSTGNASTHAEGTYTPSRAEQCELWPPLNKRAHALGALLISGSASSSEVSRMQVKCVAEGVGQIPTSEVPHVAAARKSDDAAPSSVERKDDPGVGGTVMTNGTVPVVEEPKATQVVEDAGDEQQNEQGGAGEEDGESGSSALLGHNLHVKAKKEKRKSKKDKKAKRKSSRDRSERKSRREEREKKREDKDKKKKKKKSALARTESKASEAEEDAGAELDRELEALEREASELQKEVEDETSETQPEWIAPSANADAVRELNVDGEAPPSGTEESSPEAAGDTGSGEDAAVALEGETSAVAVDDAGARTAGGEEECTDAAGGEAEDEAGQVVAASGQESEVAAAEELESKTVVVEDDAEGTGAADAGGGGEGDGDGRPARVTRRPTVLLEQDDPSSSEDDDEGHEEQDEMLLRRALSSGVSRTVGGGVAEEDAATTEGNGGSVRGGVDEAGPSQPAGAETPPQRWSDDEDDEDDDLPVGELLGLVAAMMGKKGTPEVMLWSRVLEQHSVRTCGQLEKLVANRRDWHRLPLPRRVKINIEEAADTGGDGNDLPSILLEGSGSSRRKSRRLSHVTPTLVEILHDDPSQSPASHRHRSSTVTAVDAGGLTIEEMLSCAKLIGMDTEAGSHEFMLPEYMEEAARPDCSFSAEELEWMHRVLDLCQVIHGKAVVRLYVADPPSEGRERAWRYSGLMGGIAILTESNLQMACAHYLRLIDLEGWNPNRSVIMEQELFKDFEYVKLTPFFHVFEMNEHTAGLSFCSEVEADKFYDAVRHCIDKTASDVIDELYEQKEMSFMALGVGIQQADDPHTAALRRKYAAGGIPTGTELRWSKPELGMEVLEELHISPGAEPEDDEQKMLLAEKKIALLMAKREEAEQSESKTSWTKNAQNLLANKAVTELTDDEKLAAIDKARQKIKKLKSQKKAAKSRGDGKSAEAISTEIGDMYTAIYDLEESLPPAVLRKLRRKSILPFQRR